MIRLLKLVTLLAVAGATVATVSLWGREIAPAAYPAAYLSAARDAAETAAAKVGGSIEQNPWPVGLAVGTFLLTVLYHRVRGASTRQALEAAALRGAVATPVRQPGRIEEVEPESDVLARAKARSLRAQLCGDRIMLEQRLRKLPAEVGEAERETVWADREAEEARAECDRRDRVASAADQKLHALRAEQDEKAAELAKIDAELGRLAPLV